MNKENNDSTTIAALPGGPTVSEVANLIQTQGLVPAANQLGVKPAVLDKIRIGYEIQVKIPENLSGQGKSSAVPDEIKKWNWGAFLMNWIWGLGSGTYIALLCLVPLVGIVAALILEAPMGAVIAAGVVYVAIAALIGARGSEWAWQNARWHSIEHFRSAQRKWIWWWFCLVLIGILIVLIEMVLDWLATLY